MQTVNYNNDKARCKCGGRIMYGGSATHKVPQGFGGHTNGLLVISIVEKGWIGDCMTCRDKVFAVTSRKVQRKVVRIKAVEKALRERLKA